MTINKLINQLTKAREQVGENCEVPVVRIDYEENDYIIPSYVVVGDLKDQDGREFKCDIVGDDGGEELTKVGTDHYKWNPKKDKVS